MKLFSWFKKRNIPLEILEEARAEREYYEALAEASLPKCFGRVAMINYSKELSKGEYKERMEAIQSKMLEVILLAEDTYVKARAQDFNEFVSSELKRFSIAYHEEQLNLLKK